jgi:hypothetical protein
MKREADIMEIDDLEQKLQSLHVKPENNCKRLSLGTVAASSFYAGGSSAPAAGSILLKQKQRKKKTILHLKSVKIQANPKNPLKMRIIVFLKLTQSCWSLKSTIPSNSAFHLKCMHVRCMISRKMEVLF